ncbi:hypothetical protein HXX76_002332 [Chlamydomonas incerta]|uniref:Uncharacterized protein n=1 Tax=Chlamydomonas incerta TaxID=51695 RepID=A0A835SGS5_CHLIN|nr:hypothetical protein HXX76_002332 [Chlamydomonas incerta]|eukprot:KAG2423108.1 hypothetical protein HXX76_002332 [Chlamydomonas incerta]
MGTVNVYRAQQPWPERAFLAHWGRSEPWRALALRQRRRLLCLAASSCHAGSLDTALAHCGCTLPPELMTAAAAAGNAAGCERLLAAGCKVGWHGVITAAAEAGHLPVLQLLFGNIICADTPNFLRQAARGACAGGHADILAWLQQAHGWRPILDNAKDAAREGQVAMLELLLPQPASAPAAAGAGYGDRFRRDHHALLWEPGAAAAAAGAAAFIDGDLDHPSLLADSRLGLLHAIIQGCPVEVLQRHYEPLSRGWMPAGPEERAAAAQPHAWAAWDTARGERVAVLVFGYILACALQSRMACWRAKLDFLLSAWGPAVAAALTQYVAVSEQAVVAATTNDDCLQRLQWLRAHGFHFGAHTAECVAWRGNAEALAYLWDECGVPGPMSSPDPAGVFLRGCSRTVSRYCQRDAGVKLRVLQLLAMRGAVLSAEHAAMAARCPGQEPMLLYLAEAAEPVTERGGDVWDQALLSAAQHGASLVTLRVLRQRRGAAVDLAAVACGGSEEALDWAAAELAAEGSVLQLLEEGEAARVEAAGNTAAMDWLRGRGLLPPPPTRSRASSAAASQR